MLDEDRGSWVPLRKASGKTAIGDGSIASRHAGLFAGFSQAVSNSRIGAVGRPFNDAGS